MTNREMVKDPRVGGPKLPEPELPQRVLRRRRISHSGGRRRRHGSSAWAEARSGRGGT